MNGQHVPGPWLTMRQPGGLWIADRVNANCPGGFERLPKKGAFRTEAAALAAIDSACNFAQSAENQQKVDRKA